MTVPLREDKKLGRVFSTELSHNTTHAVQISHSQLVFQRKCLPLVLNLQQCRGFTFSLIYLPEYQYVPKNFKCD